MGRGGYLGGHTRIFPSEGGTTWKLIDRPQPKTEDPRKRWDREPGVPPSEEQRGIRLQRRSFLSMCAVAFCGDVLTDNVPEPPDVIRKEVKHAGGNRRWIAGDALRLKHFKDLYEVAKRRSEG
jgi:hypothetical protein